MGNPQMGLEHDSGVNCHSSVSRTLETQGILCLTIKIVPSSSWAASEAKVSPAKFL